MPAASSGEFTVEDVSTTANSRVVLYGTGGIGKTTCACLSSQVCGPTAFIDLDRSLGKIKTSLNGCNIKTVAGIETWDQLRAALHADIWGDFTTIVIDSITRAEELAMYWVLANVRHETGKPISRLEDYGYGKGYQHLYETILCLFGDLDQHWRRGKNIILIAHEITAEIPNPAGENFLRWEPRLFHQKNEKNSIRLKAKEWADHVLYLGYDLVASQEGKARGSGSRTIYPRELPWCTAKSRTLSEPISFIEGDTELWKQLFAS